MLATNAQQVIESTDTAKLEFYRLIKELNEAGTTIIMVSHDMQVAKEYASHILHVGKKQLFFGTKDDYFTSHAEKTWRNEE